MKPESIKVAAVTVNQTPLDWEGNCQRLKHFLLEAKEHGAQIVCFPELCITGYGCEDMFLSLHTFRKSEMVLQQLLPYTKEMLVTLGMPVFHRGAIYNCAVVIRDTQILGVNPKKLLPREGIHYEGRWFQPGPFQSKEQVQLLGEERPFGHLRYHLGGLGLAIEICEEAWQSHTSATEHALAGVEVVLNPSASHFAFGKYKVRQTIVANNSRSLQVFYVHTNLLGLESGRIIYDGGSLIAENGRIVARGPRLGFKDGYVTYADIDIDRVRVGKIRNRSERIFVAHNEDLAVYCHKPWNQADHKKPCPVYDRVHFEAKKGQWELEKEEEFLAAEMLGLFDYWRKSGSQGFVLSLSGGCDSSSVAVLIAHMLHSAFKELGSQSLGARVPSLKGPKAQIVLDTPEKWLLQILTTVYQATENSTAMTRTAAANLAKQLQSSHIDLELQDIVDSYVSKACDIFKRKLTWEKDDISLQNIQARARAPMVWLVANITGKLLLSTSNRSEAAVGYATMDGDTAGGLAPLGGIDKDFLSRWLIWAEKDCRWGAGPLESLRNVNSQKPTAELRPQNNNQKDEVDLMPYDVLARIEHLFIRELMAPKAILQNLIIENSAISPDLLRSYLKKFLHLWSRNQWKRERLAPSFLLDEGSLDPKTWCRYPILSGSFQTEIDEI